MTEFHKAPDGNPERFKKYPNGFKETETFFSKEKNRNSILMLERIVFYFANMLEQS